MNQEKQEQNDILIKMNEELQEQNAHLIKLTQELQEQIACLESKQELKAQNPVRQIIHY